MSLVFTRYSTSFNGSKFPANLFSASFTGRSWRLDCTTPLHCHCFSDNAAISRKRQRQRRRRGFSALRWLIRQRTVKKILEIKEKLEESEQGGSGIKRMAAKSGEQLQILPKDKIPVNIKGIVSTLHLIRDKAQKDGQKKNEETISSVGSEVKSMIEGLRSKIEKDRQSFAKALSKSSKEYESSLKNETAKFQAFHENFCKEKATSLQALKDIISKFEEEKEKLFVRYEQLRKKERVMISEQEKACNHKIAQLEDSLRKKKQDDKTFSILRKTLGSFLESTSDEDFPPDD
ncbi:hypothetical protein JHK87_027908 [Glycine soja]|nr:hypothetical protein JHK87_027908 [Glycine soja]